MEQKIKQEQEQVSMTKSQKAQKFLSEVQRTAGNGIGIALWGAVSLFGIGLASSVAKDVLRNKDEKARIKTQNNQSNKKK